MPQLLLATLLLAVGLTGQAAPVIQVGYYEFPPYAWTDDQGQPRGNVLDLTERLLRHAGYRGHYRSLPSARLYAGLRDGSVHLWPGAGGKVELLEHTHASRQSLGDFTLALYRRPGTPEPRLPEDLQGRQLIMITGYSYWPDSRLPFNTPGLKFDAQRTNSHSSALAMLLRKRGDYLLDYQAPVEQARLELGIQPLPYTVVLTIESRLVASRRAPGGGQQLVDALDRAYAELQAAGVDLQLD